ncbi:MAG: hypothetical protein AB7P49_14500 [Bdellovibrionales bacterium]
MLSKVSDVVEEHNASKVVVHGSQASQVADYLGREIKEAEIQAVQGKVTSETEDREQVDVFIEP